MYLPRTYYFSRKQKENITKFHEKNQSKNHYNTRCFMKGNKFGNEAIGQCKRYIVVLGMPRIFKTGHLQISRLTKISKRSAGVFQIQY